MDIIFVENKIYDKKRVPIFGANLLLKELKIAD
jgi:hypothetical protein